MKKILSLLAMIAALADAQAADVTYVDAIADSNIGTVNTVATAGGTLASWYVDTGTSNTQNDDHWTRRADTGFGNGANDIFQGRVVSTNSLPELTTTITGLNAGESYNIYAFFWDASGTSQWTLDAGSVSGALTTYTEAAPAASTLTFTTVVSTASDNRTLYYGNIGTIVANGSGEIAVFIDNSTSSGGDATNKRSWYDGVGYSAVPEPGTYALLVGLISFTAIMVRRRK